MSHTRHLLYHLTPIGRWKSSLEKLFKYWSVFNGTKTIAIALCDNSERLFNFEEIFSGEHEAKLIKIKNDPLLRETASFELLLSEVSDKISHRDITFYCHSKGVTHHPNKAVQLWTKGCYEYNLGDIEEVEKQLSWFPIVGSFKRYGVPILFPKGTNNWYYSGTFFWFRNHEIFKRDWRKAVTEHRYGAEAFPSYLFKPTEGGVIFGDGVGDMYDLREVKRVFYDGV